MARIRPATEADRPFVLALKTAYVARTAYGRFLTDVAASFDPLFDLCLEFVLLVAVDLEDRPVGAIGFTGLDHMGERIADEIAYDVVPGTRGRARILLELLEAGMAEVARKGATVVKLSAPASAVPLADLYKRRGCVAVETVYLVRAADGFASRDRRDGNDRRSRRGVLTQAQEAAGGSRRRR